MREDRRFCQAMDIPSMDSLSGIHELGNCFNSEILTLRASLKLWTEIPEPATLPQTPLYNGLFWIRGNYERCYTTRTNQGNRH